jgi:hypothetical protein
MPRVASAGEDTVLDDLMGHGLHVPVGAGVPLMLYTAFRAVGRAVGIVALIGGCGGPAVRDPLSSYGDGVLTVEDLLAYDGEDHVPAGLRVSLSLPSLDVSQCPTLADVRATVNGRGLELVERGGPGRQSTGCNYPFFDFPVCDRAVLEAKGDFPRDRPIDVEITDGVTTIEASFRPATHPATAALRREGAALDEGSPALIVRDATYLLRWSDDAPLVDALERPPVVRLLGLEAVGGGTRERLDATHDPAARETRFTARLDQPDAVERLRGKGELPLRLVALYRIDRAMGHEPVLTCEGVAGCRCDRESSVEATLPIRFVAELPPGTDGGPCYGNGTCDAGWRCRDGLCR